MKRIVILGSTGSIGRSTLRVVRALAPRFKVVGLSTRHRYEEVLRQAAAFGVKHVAVADEASAIAARRRARGVKVHAGASGVAELAALDADIVVCAVVGVSGLRPVLAALERGTDVALATKEVLVAAGEIVTRLSRRRGARILPVDSEHSALFQCLGASAVLGRGPDAKRSEVVMRRVRRLVLTASGGPFAGRSDVDLNRVTVNQALTHPSWDMGRKVTIDSATLMNKGLETIEAHWLFDVPMDRIDVVIHPESVVHSLVEFVDGSVLAQMGMPDMRLAIQYALTWPDRVDGGLPRLDLAGRGALHFRAPDAKRFPALGLARTAARVGGSLPCVMNAANEVAVDRFLQGRMPFSGIWRLTEHVMEQHRVVRRPDLDDIVAADAWARAAAQERAVRMR